MLDNIDIYVNTPEMKVNVYPSLKPHIIPVYPPNNDLIFEEWFDIVYRGCKTDRVYLPIFWTSYYVNNDYGKNEESLKVLHFFLQDLDKLKKYFTLVQYDDGTMIDWNLLGLDVLEFNMSKQKGCMIPLLCQPHPYKFTTGKKWLASFVGSRTHPIRNELERFIGKEGYYISFDQHSIETYCRVLHESVLAFCPRGYGATSFRISEALQYKSIPVYMSDEYIIPFDSNFEEYGFLVNGDVSKNIEDFMDWVSSNNIMERQNRISINYDKYYTYESCFKHIIKYLETECDLRK